MSISEIQVDIIQPSIREEISSFLQSRIRWRTIGIYMETTSKIMLGTTSILAFATSIYPCNSYLSFIAGTVSTMSLVSLQFANYSFRESKLSTENLNVLLSKMKGETLPELNGSVLKESPLGSLKNNKTSCETNKEETTRHIENTNNTSDMMMMPQLYVPDITIISTEILNQI
jgi:hypothetical protein